jgi:hypothetical protein
MHVGNLIVGEKYIEPQGKITIKNQSTGDTCEIDYKPRSGWFNNENQTGKVDGVVKDSQGKVRFTISGRYLGAIFAKDVETDEQFEVFKAMDLPQNSNLMFNFN